MQMDDELNVCGYIKMNEKQNVCCSRVGIRIND